MNKELLYTIAIDLLEDRLENEMASNNENKDETIKDLQKRLDMLNNQLSVLEEKVDNLTYELEEKVSEIDFINELEKNIMTYQKKYIN